MKTSASALALLLLGTAAVVQGQRILGKDKLCSFAQFAVKIQMMDAACCPIATFKKSCDEQLPATCTLPCAGEFLPFYRDCMNTIDMIYDVQLSADKTDQEDGKADNFATFEGICLTIDIPLVFKELDSLLDRRCTVDLGAIVAHGTPSPPPPAGCVDNDAAVMKILGQTCDFTFKLGLCRALWTLGHQDMCACSCADKPADPTTRPTMAPTHHGDTFSPTAMDAASIDSWTDPTSHPGDGVANRRLTTTTRSLKEAARTIKNVPTSALTVRPRGIKRRILTDRQVFLDRKLFGTLVKDAEPDHCPIEQFKSKLEVVQTACCDTGACSHTVMPSSCDFDCAEALPIFMTHCNKLIEEVLKPNEYYGLKHLEGTCGQLPIRPMIDAIKRATPTCPNATVTHSPTGQCTDTPKWDNGAGQTCLGYGHYYCKEGRVKAGQEFAVGYAFHSPEQNCCVCGKGNPGIIDGR